MHDRYCHQEVMEKDIYMIMPSINKCKRIFHDRFDFTAIKIQNNSIIHDNFRCVSCK